MALAVDYTINLVDKLSGPAATAASSLNKAGRAMRDTKEKLEQLKQKQVEQASGLGKTAAALDALVAKEGKGSTAVDALTKTFNKQADAARSTAVAIRNTGEKVKDLSEASNKPAGKSLSSMASGVTDLLGPLALAFVSFKALTGVAGVALEARAHKLNTLGQLQSVTQSADKAKEVYNHTQKIADNLNVSQDKVQEVALDLMKSRLPSTSLEGTITAITALEKGQGPEAAAKLTALVKGSAFKKSFGITREDAMALGTNTNEIYSEIAKNTHQGVDEVRAQMQYGQVSAKDGLDALNTLLTRKNKAALDIAKMDPSALFGKFKETLGRLFEDIDLGPIGDALKQVTLMFDRTTVTGKSFKALLNGAAKLIGATMSFVIPIVGTLIDKFTLLGLKVYVALIPVFGSVRRAFKALGVDGEGVGGAMSKAFSAVLVIVEKIGQVLSVVGSGIEITTKLLKGDTKGASKAGDALGAKVYAALNPEGGLLKQGGSIVDGLSFGMLSKLGLIEDTSARIAQAVPDTVAEKLQIHSPSRVLMAQGKHAGDGFALGVEGSKGPDALGDFEGSKSASPSGRGGAAPVAAGATYTFGDFVFNGVASGTDAAAIAKSVYTQFTEQLESLATQLGQPVGYGQ